MGILEMLGMGGGTQDESQYSDVPFGVRLALASQAAVAMDQGKMPGTEGLATMAAMRERAIERRREDAKTQKQQDMASRLADKIEATNPMFAAALRADPSLVDDFMKQDLQNQQWKDQYGTQRKDSLADWNMQQKAAQEAAALKRQQELEDLKAATEAEQAKTTATMEADARKRQAEQEFQMRKLAEEQRLIAEREQARIKAEIEGKTTEERGKRAPQDNLLAQMFKTVTPGGLGAEPQGPMQPGKAVSYGYVPGTSNVPMTGDPSQDIWRGMFDTQNISPSEARRLALAAAEGASVRDEYGKIVDDRPKVQKTQVLDTPKLKQDYMWKDPVAAERGDYSAGQAVIPGSAAELELKQNTEKLAAAERRKAIEKSAYGRSVKRAIELIDKGESGETLPAAGWGGLWRMAPETASMSLASELTTITGNLGLDKLQAMREAAAAAGGTGASGLGSVTDYENRLLQSTIEALNQNEDPKILRERLVRLDKMVESVVDGTLMKDTAQLKELVSAAQTPEEKAQLIQFFEEEYGSGSANEALAQ